MSDEETFERKLITGHPDPIDLLTDKTEDGLTIFLKVNYKVILLVVVVTDFLHSSINEIFSHLFGI